MFDWGGIVGLSGPAAIGITLVILGLLSRRLGRVIRTPPYYLGFFVGAGLIAVTVLARILNIGRGAGEAATLRDNPLWVILYIGLPAIALTLSVVVAWRYWSWLLAERG